MNSLTQPFTPGKRYRFQPRRGRDAQTTSAIEYHAWTLAYLRDERGDRCVHHVFQWIGGALECFSDRQLEDFQIREM